MKLQPQQQLDWEYGFQLACQLVDDVKIGSHISVRYLENGEEVWYGALVTGVTSADNGKQSLRVLFDNGEKDTLLYPEQDIVLDLPPLAKRKLPKREFEDTKREYRPRKNTLMFKP